SDYYGCIGIESKAITILPPPSVASIVGVDSICTKMIPFVLADATSNGVWNSSDNFKAPITASGLVTPIDTGLFTFSYSVTNASGCTDSAVKRVYVYRSDNTVTRDGDSLNANWQGAGYQWYDCSNGFAPI